MIYRIKNLWSEEDGVSDLDNLINDILLQAGVRIPDILVPRARFFFTAAGWKIVGKLVAECMYRHHVKPRIERRKNPKPSDILYSDALQVAIIP